MGRDWIISINWILLGTYVFKVHNCDLEKTYLKEGLQDGVLSWIIKIERFPRFSKNINHKLEMYYYISLEFTFRNSDAINLFLL